MMTDHMTAAAAATQTLIEAHAAVKARPGHALAEVLLAIKAVALGGTVAQFVDADQLLDTETFTSGLFAPAIKPLLEARAAAQLRDVPWIVACLSRRLAWVYDFAGDDVAAIEMIEDARSGFQTLGDFEALSRSLNNLGVIWIRRNDLVGAERVLNEALLLADRINVPVERARVRINYGHLCGMLGEYERGKQMLTTAFELLVVLGHPAQTAALLNLARLALAQGRTDEATTTLDRAHKLIGAGNRLGRIEGCLVRGQIASREARHDVAMHFFNEGIAMAAETGALREEKELWEALSNARAAASDFQQAYEATQRGLALDDRLRRERALLQAATTVERRAAERAQHEADIARANEVALRETLSRLERTQSDLERANSDKDTLLAELHRQTREDPLTRLLNRRALNTELERECTRAERYSRPLALALLDIDNFKQINDTRSHAVGDAVLVTVAQCLRDARRHSDVVARLGGEEMVVLFPETAAEQALAACEALREQLSAINWLAMDAPGAVTASFGVAVFRAGDNAATMLARADAAMYSAKRAGKDRVTLAT